MVVFLLALPMDTFPLVSLVAARVLHRRVCGYEGQRLRPPVHLRLARALVFRIDTIFEHRDNLYTRSRIRYQRGEHRWRISSRIISKGICWGHAVVTGAVPVVLKPVRPKAFVKGITRGILRKGSIRGCRWQAVPSGSLFVFLVHPMKAMGPGSCWWTRPSRSHVALCWSRCSKPYPRSAFF